MSGGRLGGQIKLVSSLTRSGSSRGQSDSIVNAIRLRLDSNGDIDLRRATRLTVRDGDFTYLEVAEVEESPATSRA